jgi:hypothetical protein
MNRIELGQKISRDTLKARWAYAELTSSRFANSYTGLVSDGLFARARGNVPFGELSENDRNELIEALNRHKGRCGLVPALAPHESFICVAWTREQLLATICVPGLQWIPLADLVSMRGPFERSHPRAAAKEIPSNQEIQQIEPIIVLPDFIDLEHRGPLLLEGTFRSVMFLRCRDPSARIMVWIPMTAPGVSEP